MLQISLAIVLLRKFRGIIIVYELASGIGFERVRVRDFIFFPCDEHHYPPNLIIFSVIRATSRRLVLV